MTTANSTIPVTADATIWGYQRVSHVDSKQSGNGFEVQRTSIEHWVESLIRRYPHLKFGGWFQDDVVSGRIPLAKRKAGRFLVDRLRPGDHVVFSRIDRGFRNMRDLTNMLETWLDKGVGVHFADLNIDATTPSGKMTLHVIGSMAEYEASMVGLRNRETIAVLRKAGRFVGGNPPLGFKWHSPGGNQRQRLVTDTEQRRVMQEIVRVRLTGLSWVRIADHIERKLAEYEHRPYRLLGFRKKMGGWSPKTCERAYHRELELQAKKNGQQETA